MAVYVPTYNERGVLVSETIDVGALKTETGHKPSAAGPTSAIVDISYDAKGQKESVKNGNQTETTYVYNRQTFRLMELKTTRPGSVKATIGLPILKNANVLQDLQYAYDPVGNITEIRDNAFQPTFFQNQQVDAVSRYAYDALYRLTEGTGRENFQANTAPGQFEDDPFAVQFPIDQANTLRNYTQTYSYDPVGNIDQIRHVAGAASWTRNYVNALDSNRVSRTWTNADLIGTLYRYDVHGNMLNLANVADAQLIRWDYRDMVRAIDLVGGGWSYYNYDAGKQRTRKVIETQSGVKRWERIDLSGLEIYRRYSGGNIVEEIESQHLFEGEQRVLLVDDVLQTDNSRLPVGPLFRYQYSNHLGSTCLEASDQAAIIRYEEYHPYGTTAYRARNSSIETPPSRYRYAGLERDEESGLSYHSARYYPSWLCRWLSPDPIGIGDGPNLFRAFQSNPIVRGIPQERKIHARPMRHTRFRSAYPSICVIGESVWITLSTFPITVQQSREQAQRRGDQL